MTCYARPLAAIAVVIAVAVVAVLHLGVSVPPALVILAAATAVLLVLGWIALIISRNRAQDGACTSCRLRCQQPAVRPAPEPVQLPWPHAGQLRGDGRG
jgi:ABC-type transport system involved in cytochrome bd biosynthesis fused ATPase/permease subunit